MRVRSAAEAVATAAAAAVTALTLLAPVPAQGQEFPSFAGAEVRLGGNSPVDWSTGFSGSLDVDLGYLQNPFIRTILGFSYFRGGVTVDDVPPGNYDAIGGRAALRADFFDIGTVRPYVLAGVTAHNVSADILHPVTASLLEGFYVGAAFGLGLLAMLDDEQRFGVTGEFRRVFANNIGHWGFEFGARWSPLGRRAYERPEQRVDRDRERAFEERRRMLEEARDERRAREEEERRAREAEEQRVREEEEWRARERPEVREPERLTAAERELRWNLLDLERDLRIVTAVQETGRGLVVTLGRDLFRTGEHTPHRMARDELASLAEVLGGHPDLRLSVEAYAGERDADRRLAQRRAEAVRAALVVEGMDPARISVEREPRGAPDRERVEIVVLTGQAGAR